MQLDGPWWSLHPKFGGSPNAASKPIGFHCELLIAPHSWDSYPMKSAHTKMGVLEAEPSWGPNGLAGEIITPRCKKSKNWLKSYGAAWVGNIDMRSAECNLHLALRILSWIAFKYPYLMYVFRSCLEEWCVQEIPSPPPLSFNNREGIDWKGLWSLWSLWSHWFWFWKLIRPWAKDLQYVACASWGSD